jgi:hypothetical protein
MYIIKSVSGHYEFSGNQKDALQSAKEYSFYNVGSPVYLLRPTVYGTERLYRIVNGKAHKFKGDEKKPWNYD